MATTARDRWEQCKVLLTAMEDSGVDDATCNGSSTIGDQVRAMIDDAFREIVAEETAAATPYDPELTIPLYAVAVGEIWLSHDDTSAIAYHRREDAEAIATDPIDRVVELVPIDWHGRVKP